MPQSKKNFVSERGPRDVCENDDGFHPGTNGIRIRKAVWFDLKIISKLQLFDFIENFIGNFYQGLLLLTEISMDIRTALI